MRSLSYMIFPHLLYFRVHKNVLSSGFVVNVAHGFWFYYLIVPSLLYGDSEIFKIYTVVITTFQNSLGIL